MKHLVAGWVLIILTACKAPGHAPIGDIAKSASKPASSSRNIVRPSLEIPQSQPVAGTATPGSAEVVVQKGDTLFAIAFQNGLDYRDLATWNNLSSPDSIQIGQVLRLNPPGEFSNAPRSVETLPLRKPESPVSSSIKEAPLLTEPKSQRLAYSEANWAILTGKAIETKSPVPKTSDAPADAASDSRAVDDEWRWPADGPLIGRYGEGGGKGINIAGEKQSPVYASGPGKVVYSGAGLRGYGKMVIVKHPGEYLSAYAHNHDILVKEGQWVKSGQKIAEMGDTDSDRIKLHFEIRQFGKPVDPLKILPERK